MSMYTRLGEGALQRHLKAFRLGTLIEARGIATRTAHLLYDVRTTEGRFLLRVLEDRSSAEARFEQAVLAHLTDRGLPVPMMMEAGRYGAIVSLGTRKHLSIFAHMPGREIGVFEVTPSHAAQTGAFLATMHLASRGLRRRRRHRFGPDRVRTLIERCLTSVRDRRRRRDLLRLRKEAVELELDAGLPSGIIHANLTIDRTRFLHGRLVGVVAFDSASTGPLVYDLAIALSDWAFPLDVLRPENVRAFVGGYESERPLKTVEREALYDLVRFALVRFAVTRFYEFEVQGSSRSSRRYEDYRHPLKRLDAWRHLGVRGLNAVLGYTRSRAASPPR